MENFYKNTWQRPHSLGISHLGASQEIISKLVLFMEICLELESDR